MPNYTIDGLEIRDDAKAFIRRRPDMDTGDAPLGPRLVLGLVRDLLSEGVVSVEIKTTSD
jgi:hypothetical protein